MAFRYDDPEDEESVRLQEMLDKKPIEDVIRQVTGLETNDLIEKIKDSIQDEE